MASSPLAKKIPPRRGQPPRKRRPYHHGNLRNALLDAAVALVDLHGPQALTLREAARRAGVSQTAPYRHFADLEALTAAVAADGFLMLVEDLAPALALPPAHREAALAAAYAQFAADNRGRFALMFSHTLTRADDGLAHARGALEDLLSDGLGRERARSVWAFVHGRAALALAGLQD